MKETEKLRYEINRLKKLTVSVMKGFFIAVVTVGLFCLIVGYFHPNIDAFLALKLFGLIATIILGAIIGVYLVAAMLILLPICLAAGCFMLTMLLATILTLIKFVAQKAIAKVWKREADIRV